MRNFRLGEWLPEAVTPLFGDLAAAGAGGRLPRRHARHRRGAGAVPVRAGQRLVLQRHPDPVTAAAGPGAVAGTRPRGEDLVQRADPGRPQPGRRRPGGAVGSGPAVARGAAARVPAAGRRRRRRGPDGATGPAGAAGRHAGPARPGSTCGTWRSWAGRRGRWRPA